MIPRTLALSSALALLVSCDPAEEPLAAPPRVQRVAAVVTGPDRAAQKKIVAFGDSLTAGYGIGLDEAYPAVLQRLLDAEGYPYEVVNAGVSGDTSAGGVRRLDWVLDGRDVEILILALGANDGLRGLPPSEMKKNLAEIIEHAKSRGVRVLLAGFEAPPGARDVYIQDFVAVFPELASEHEIALMPSLLHDIAGVARLNQEDGKHPNVEGARVLAESIFRSLKPLLPMAGAAESAQ
ncbi:MAG: arylesterase [Vicinamibacteria bacterium]